MARTKKVQLSFNRGALSPHLDGRLDLYQAGNALRTCRNFLVEREGGVKRRPGTRFIAQAGAGIELSHVSYTGSATYYGITELASVSDPPRKYLQLVPNYRGLVRSIIGDTGLGFGAINRTVYDLTGTRTGQVIAWIGVADGSPWALGAGGSLASPGDSLESARWDLVGAPWTNTEPTWHRSRLVKWFTTDDFTTPGTATSERISTGQGFGNLGGVISTTRGLGIIAVWNGAGWTLTLHFYGEGKRALYMRVAAGDQDPGTVTTADTFLISTTVQFPTASVFLPPDCSVRFMARLTVGGPGEVQIPQQIGTTISSGAEASSGLTVDAYDRWLYLAETETLQPEGRFEETLCNEDTLTAAIQRSSDVVTGEASVARTETLTGGTGAESNVPIEWEGTVVQTSKLISGLTIGHRYSVNVTVRSNTIGGADFATTIEAGAEFVALATSTQVTHEVRAGVGKEKRVLNIVVVDQGAEPDAPTNYDPDALLWQGNVLANGGTLESDSLQIASDLITALKAAGLWTKLPYILPMLGADLTAALVPLRDSGTWGAPTNTAFLDANFDQTTGLAGDGSTKHLAFGFAPGELGASNSGGLGAWALTVDGSAGTQCLCGMTIASNAQTYGLRFGNTGPSDINSEFTFGAYANRATLAALRVAANWFGQRASSTSRALYKDGVSVASNTTSDTASGADDRDLLGFAVSNAAGSTIARWNGRVGCFYFSNGTLTAGEVQTLHDVLRDELMIPTGRVTP